MKPGVPYPGIVVRYESGVVKSVTNINSQTGGATLNSTIGREIVIRRINGIVSYSVDGGQTFIDRGDYSNFTHPFDVPATFGAGFDATSSPFRYFVGRLSNLSVEFKEAEFYTVKYSANGGTGTVDNQLARNNENLTLASNSFTRSQYMFNGWNTQADGNGQSYSPGDVVTNIANIGETITLYAQWRQAIRYNVIFHSNTVADETLSQQYTYSISAALNENTFSNQGYYFAAWNTEPDGSGTYYDDEQIVSNLCDIEGDNLDLYAIWTNDAYTYGQTVFDGTNNINTGIYLFNNANVNKNFKISFEIVERLSTGNLETMISAMDETRDPWPGIAYRVSAANQNTMIANASSSAKNDLKHSSNNITKVTIIRENGIVYYRTNKGEVVKVTDMASLIHTFDVPLVIGSSLKADGTPQRYFKGTLSNIKILLY